MEVKNGCKVKLHYTGKLEDGTVFDSSEGKDPLEFNVGEGMVIPGFEAGIMGMKEGEEKELTIPPEKAYGPVNEKLSVKVPKESFGDNVEKVKEGVVLRIMSPQGVPMNARVIKVEDKEVSLDLNHPLAGKTLNFKIKIVSVGEADKKEEPKDAPAEEKSEEAPAEEPKEE